MTQSIYGINYEVLDKNNPCLVFTKDNPWMECDLIPMEKSMLLNYPILRLLPLEINEMNMQISLSYKLGIKKSLLQLAQQQSISEVDCLRILYTIVTTIADSNVHLLSTERYLIQASFIYIGADYLDVNLIYLPIYELTDKPTLPLELLQLITDLLQKQREVQSQQVIAMIQLLKSADFQLTTLKERLLQVITELETPALSISPFDHFSQTSRQLSIHEEKFKDKSPENTWLPPTTIERIKMWGMLKSHNPLLFTVSLFSIVLIWVLYIYFSSVGMLNLCLGLSLLILNISFWFNRSLSTMETGELSYNDPINNQVQVELHLPLIPTSNYYEQLANQTTLLTPMKINSDATVLLPPYLKAFLELKQEENTELIELSCDSFIIGRNIEVAQYYADWLGLSRSHIMINSFGNGYEVKDLGSKNGSFLNEEAMIPYQVYPLNEGDCIKIVEKQFIYKKL